MTHDRMVDELQRRHPGQGPIELVRAPGRVNLIGEHTDYNEGFVLPVAIDLEVTIALRPAPGRRVELTSLDLDETDGFALDGLVPREHGQGHWIDYPAATAWALGEAGFEVRGFQGVIRSTVPIGSGLASSAAIELASAWALMEPAVSSVVPASQLAQICQRAEVEYVGVKSGIMDQFSSAAGQAGHAILLDCRTLEARAVPLPVGLAIVVANTSSPRRLEASAYNERVAECQEAVRIIAQREPGVRALRDVDPEMLARHRDRMGAVVGRRAEHIVEENRRVHRLVAALEAGDRPEVGRLMAASHASLRDLYEVSSPELDAMAEIAWSVPGLVGARMTGAGFGGCTVNLVEEDAVEALRDAIRERYPPRTGLIPVVHVARAVDGAGPA